jgi:hypothetical protein
MNTIKNYIDNELIGKIKVDYEFTKEITLDASIVLPDGTIQKVPLVNLYFIKTSTGRNIPLFYIRDCLVRVNVKGEKLEFMSGIEGLNDLPIEVLNLIRKYTKNVNAQI